MAAGMTLARASDFTSGRKTLLTLAAHTRLVRDNREAREKLASLKLRFNEQGRELREARATIERLRRFRPVEALP